MSDVTVAKRYASALKAHAENRGALAAVDKDVAVIAETLQSNPELVRLFGSPIVSRDRKERVIEGVFGKHVHTATLEFMRLLIEKHREELFPQVVEAYRRGRDEDQNIIDAFVRTALPLTETEISSIQTSLEQRSGKKVRMRVTEDPSLIGGLVVRIGDTVYDGSLSNRLTALRERLVGQAA